MTVNASHCDVVLLGGGLASCLIAWRLRTLQPELHVRVLERDAGLGGIHTWSFHDTDLSEEERAWVEPLVSSHWPTQTVRFPGYHRTLAVGYNSISAERFDTIMRSALGDSLETSATVTHIDGDKVYLANGKIVAGNIILDGRGPTPTAALATGFQTFVGQELELTEPHGLTSPVIMDSTVEQIDGYRFVYLLPMTATRLLVEDTYYNNHPDLDITSLRDRIAAYVKVQGWTVAQLHREESGVLPIVMAGDLAALSAESGPGVLPIGMRAGLFHAVTGYSLPSAVHLADSLAALRPFTAETVTRALQRITQSHWHEQTYFRLLNRMLFLAAGPSGRRKIFERFYTLSQPLIERFYAGRLRATDKARILMGKPPVPVSAAVKVLSETSAWLPRQAGNRTA
jgi:lycopene beta-cyclase